MALNKPFGDSGFYAITHSIMRTRLSCRAVFFLFAISGVVAQVQVLVRDNNVDQALKALKKKLQREGVFREMKLRRHYEKPSERRAREAAEAVRRARKMERKRIEREGF
jgi:small subunit ribosomal protein S21